MFYDEVMNAVYYIQACVACRPRSAVILGSGLGSIADQLENRELLSYADIPVFRRRMSAAMPHGSCSAR